ncbi:unnamed protein product [Porites evermanni]|uniref:Uncharacterized protein n=1 Tax=Porites evermanni TaxID=104178 RepID=A0ABN8SU33_9CNID|nr:unnamed protein product [Porites evermanni]
MVIGWATRQGGLSVTQLEALSEMISKVSWKNFCKFCSKMSKTSLLFCVVCWLKVANQPSGGSVFIPLNSKGVYGGKVTDHLDRRFVEILTRHGIKETALQQHSSLSVGTVSLPVPPANVDPSDYSKWFNEKTSTDGADVSAVRALGQDVSVEREYNESRASEFICKLDKLHRNINQTTALIQEPSPENMINMPRLRAAMDLCIEQLPTLLKIEQDGAVSVTQLLPRVLSQLRALSVYSESGSSVGADERISESMGYVLQK